MAFFRQNTPNSRRNMGMDWPIYALLTPIDGYLLAG
jgi:hypothetical protein